MIPPDLPLPIYSEWHFETKIPDGSHAGHFVHDSFRHPFDLVCSCGEVLDEAVCICYEHNSRMPKYCEICRLRGLTVSD